MYNQLQVRFLNEKTWWSWKFLVLVTFLCYCSLVFAEVNVDPVFPTPLMRMLNETVAASLRMQTENVSNAVSNTSLSDLYNDNNTQQMQIKYRTRKRQERLLLIQRDILQKLGLSKQPNVTSRLSDEERLRMIQMFDRSFDIQEDTTNDGTDSTEQNTGYDASVRNPH